MSIILQTPPDPDHCCGECSTDTRTVRSLTAAAEDVRLCRVDGETAQVVGVRLELVNALQRVVVVHADVHVVLRTRRAWQHANVNEGPSHKYERVATPHPNGNSAGIVLSF